MDYGAIAIGAAVISVVIAGVALYAERERTRYQMLTEVMRNYSHDDMGEAVTLLYDFYRYDCQKDSRKVKKNFKDRLDSLDEKKINKGSRTTKDEKTLEIHKARRRVTHFYKNMAALHKGRLLPDKTLYTLWREDYLLIIENIIIPLEEALIESRHEKPKEDEFELLHKLYVDSKGPGITIF